jgi:hypothetical protein
MEYKQKYLKYKNKYIDLKNKLGGVLPRELKISPELCGTGGSTKYIIKAHGALTGTQFKIPKGINLVTLSRLGISIPLNINIDDQLLALYAAGNTLFRDDDTTTIKEQKELVKVLMLL